MDAMNDAPTVLVVDDEPGIVDSLHKIFERESLRVLTAGSGGEALEIIRREPVSVLITDLVMPGMSGIDLLRASRSLSPETETVLMTAYGTVENAVEAMKQGAYDFVTKPLKRAQIVRVVGKAIEKRSLVQENRSLRAQLAAHKRRTLIGQSLPWRRTMDIVMQAAPSQATVLLLGESGTGKELLARAIHDNSPRAKGPFIPVNCAALPETILERSTKVDLRLVAATNQDLRAAVREGRFREDLYYRLNVIALPIPPLRHRREDIPLLAEHFLQIYGERNARRLSGFSRAAADALSRHEWPGNVRELENTVERAVVLSRGSSVELDDLPPDVRSGGAGAGDDRSLTFAVGTPLGEIERRVIHATLSHVGGDKRLCAQLLGIATRTIYRRLEEERTGLPVSPVEGVEGELDDRALAAEPRSEAASRPQGSNVPNWQTDRTGERS
jgi:two-component system response regulator HydG